MFTTRPSPAATTGAAGGATDSAATLFGSVNAFGAATSYRFEYGLTDAYGASTPIADAGSGIGEVGVAADIAGLAANTTYHYQLVALRPGIVAYGADRTFTTRPLPIQAKHPPVNTIVPVIIGAPMPGVTLTCTPGAWSFASSFAYRWLRDNVPVLAGASYRPSGLDIGHLLTCTVTASNADGSASASSAGVRILDRTAPRVTSLKLSPAAFGAAKSGPSVVTKGMTGTLATFRLDEDATVTFTVERALPGRMVKGRCQPEKRTSRTARRCMRWAAVNGSFHAAGRLGANRLRFTGRIGGRRLAPASYRLIARARDSAGNLGQPVRATFTIRR